ncbi:MAG: hypothetical protein JJ879_13170 [Sneathiella sp.]|nr:hypothetical protein [Sneathiella sp.]
MSDLITGFSASSSYASAYNAARYSNSATGTSVASSSFAQSASFSFDAFIAEDYSAPAASLPFAEGEKSSEDMLEMLEDKLTGFFAPFGRKADDLAEIVTNALESLSDLVEDTSADAAAFSLDIRFARVEHTYGASSSGFGSAGVFNGFALEISVSTAAVDYDPGRAAVVSMAGSKLEFSSLQMIEGHRTGVFRREPPGLQSMPGYSQELAEQTERVVDFLKETRKQIREFSREEEHGYRHQMKHALKNLHHMRAFA